MNRQLRAVIGRLRGRARREGAGGPAPEASNEALQRRLDALEESEQRLRITLGSMGDGVISTDDQGRITFLNPSAQELTGWTLEEARGRPFSDVFRVVDSLAGEPAEDIVRQVLATGRKGSLANHAVLIGRDGARRHISGSAAPIRSAHGETAGVVLIFSDVTERYTLQEQLRISEARTTAAVEMARLGTWDYDVRANTVAWSPVYKRIMGVGEDFEPDPGCWSTLVHPDDLPGAVQSRERAMASADHYAQQYRIFRVCDGALRYVKTHAKIQRGEGGEILRIIGALQDVTEEMEAGERIRESEKRLRRAQELAHTGNWEIDLAAMRMWASDEAFRIYGYELNEANSLPLSVPQGAVLPEDRPRLDAALERLLKCDAPYDLEFGIRRAGDGARRTVHSLAVAERDGSGRPVKVVGVLQDVTERRRLEEEYVKALATTLDGFWLCDSRIRVSLVNDAICQMLGYAREELIGMPIHELEVQTDPETVRQRRGRVLSAGAERFETRMRRKDGAVFDVEVSLSYIPSSESTCAFMRDITQRKRREEHIRYLSYHDVLTGLYNRAYFEAECQRLEAQGRFPVTVVMGDINGLKLTNDVFGHAQGDKLLSTIAGVMRRATAPEHTAARIGGDEFCILMPGAGPEDARALCERIYRVCEQEAIRLDDGSVLKPSLSMGWATRWRAEVSFGRVFKEAEDAMYKRKLLERKSMHSSLISSIRTTMYEKSRETREHADRLSEMACRLGRALQLDENQISELELLCSLHDLGKIGIPERILDKPGPLTDEEWIEMRKHPEIGYRIAQASPELISVAEGILCHHERWDGKGYPQGLREKNIPLISRILGVVDSFDAMTSDRIYHRAIPREAALTEIAACAGGQFDPAIAELFIGMMRGEGPSA